MIKYFATVNCFFCSASPEKGDVGKEIENEKILQENDILDSDRNIDNSEISINYVYTGVQWNRKDVIIDDVFEIGRASCRERV